MEEENNEDHLNIFHGHRDNVMAGCQFFEIGSRIEDMSAFSTLRNPFYVNRFFYIEIVGPIEI